MYRENKGVNLTPIACSKKKNLTPIAESFVKKDKTNTKEFMAP